MEQWGARSQAFRGRQRRDPKDTGEACAGANTVHSQGALGPQCEGSFELSCGGGESDKKSGSGMIDAEKPARSISIVVPVHNEAGHLADHAGHAGRDGVGQSTKSCSWRTAAPTHLAAAEALTRAHPEIRLISIEAADHGVALRRGILTPVATSSSSLTWSSGAQVRLHCTCGPADALARDRIEVGSGARDEPGGP